ncbi:tail fiber assembly protein [Enterobacter hormaechei]|uniref:tail fiber assembly protein n=1 Tax=Enterobacter asburiae TaxID=61645 RepID=UPI002A570FDA|nr:tail fiber assembly protein [Enterobacter hormaechei]
MKNLGKFERYTPHDPAIPGAAYLRNDDGNDWYDIAWDATRLAGNIYAGTNDDGNIVCIAEDGSALFPVDMTVWEIPADEAPYNFLTEGYQGSIIDGIYSVDKEALARNTQKRLLAEAERIIAPLERAVKHGVATKEESALLVAWEKYSIEVNRSNLMDGWPQKPS